MGMMGVRMAGSILSAGARQLMQGQRPSFRDLALGPAPMRHMANELANMRGAAMKVGQLLSMDTGDVLPAEVTEILSRLRADAHFLPPQQLRDVLDAEWGRGWYRRFKKFDVRPMAAASIGQVHRATLPSGHEVAVKVQYPGVAQSIDSDLANVSALIRRMGVLPKGFDIAPFLEEARQQLHEETDYRREAGELVAFAKLLDGFDGLRLPRVVQDFSTNRVLAMTFETGLPIDTLVDASQSVRDRVATRLVHLVLAEMFDLGRMQTDPNFANYLFDAETDQVVLLDFGASRELSDTTVDAYRAALRAGLSGDQEALIASLHGLGALGGAVDPVHTQMILQMADLAFDAMRGSDLDFGRSDLPRRLQAMGEDLARQGYAPDQAPPEAMFIQRKLGGTFLLCHRLRATVPIGDLVAPYVG
jgi:predicted unusual protein kinase regulating ubiquinone biosynthesis (AarF/ABC1/UbiB family)